MKESPEHIGFDIREEAMRLRRVLGWSVVPAEPAVFGDPKSGKRSIGTWKKDAILAASEAETEVRFSKHRHSGIALMGGRVNNLVVVDGDDQVAIDFIRTDLPPTQLISITGRGEQHFYRWPGFVVPPGAKLKGMALDLRGDGSYVIAPPSRHWSGKRYRWVTEPTKEMLKELPLFNPAWIAEPRKFKSSTIEASAADPVKRAAAYIARIEGAVSGQGGHAQTMRVAGILIQKFGLSLEQAAPLMTLWNLAKCQPPWSDAELTHKLTDAVKNIGSERSQIIKTIGG